MSKRKNQIDKQSKDTRDKFKGAFLGLAIGDAFGAPFEGGLPERFIWKLIGKTQQGEARWTDDTQMAVDLAESLLATRKIDQEDLARRFAMSYRWSRGYGPGAAKLLKRIRRGESWREASRSVYSDGSFGNGGAMRAPIVGLYFFETPEYIPEAARRMAEITHAHPLGVEGAVLIAVATGFAVSTSSKDAILEAVIDHCQDARFNQKLQKACQWLEENRIPTPHEVTKTLGNGISATESIVTAFFIALSHLHKTFEEMLASVIKGKGDTDTIGAMAGAIWGAVNGKTALPEVYLSKLEQRNRIELLSARLYENRFIRT